MSSSTALKKPGAHLNKSLWEKCDHHLLQRDFTATVPLGKLKSSFRKELERWRSKFHFSSDFTFEVLFSSVRTFSGDLFLFEIKSGMYKFSQKCTKRPNSVQNLDVRLLCFLRQKCAYFAIFGTQLRVYCDFLLKSERITGSMMENLITKWFNNIWNPQYIT